MSRSNLVDVEVIIVHQTDKAVLVKSDEEADGVWLPLSQCEVDGEPWLGLDPKPYATIRCKSDWFEDREAVSFHSDGMIGFAGWADDGNIEPIVRAFCVWCDEMRKADPISQVLDKVEAAFEDHCPTHTTEVEAFSNAFFDIRRAAE